MKAQWELARLRVQRCRGVSPSSAKKVLQRRRSRGEKRSHILYILAGDPAHARTLEELRALVDEFVDTHDRPGVYEDPVDIYRGYHKRLPESLPANKG